MQVTKGTLHMREQWVPGSLSSSPAREPGNETKLNIEHQYCFCLHQHCAICMAADVISYKKELFLFSPQAQPHNASSTFP